MRLLVINQHYWPEIAATAQILTDLCEDLAQLGHQVTVVCGQPSYRDSAQLAVRETHNGVDILRQWNYAPSKRTIPRRLAHYGSFFVGSLVQSLRVLKPDAMLVLSTPPLLLGASGALLQLTRRVPFIYSVQDLYPDIALDVGVLQPGLLADLVGVASSRLYRAAHHVVTLSDGMAEKLTSKGVSSSRLTVIPNWADTDAVTPLPRDNAFAREHGLTGSFTVQYSGNVGLSQGLERLPAAAAKLKGKGVRFAVIGDGNAMPKLREAVGRERADNVAFIPPQPRARLPEVLSACDVGLVTMLRGVGADLVPSKLYGIMAAGRPVLAAVEGSSEVARVVERYKAGVVVKPEDSDALVAGVEALCSLPGDALRAMGERGRRACVDHFSRRVCTRQYDALAGALGLGDLSRPGGVEAGRFDVLARTAAQRFERVPADSADVWLYAHDLGRPEEIQEQLPKLPPGRVPIVFFYGNDDAAPHPVNDARVKLFRSSLFASTRLPHEDAMPALCDDLMAGRLESFEREWKPVPSIGFCGFVGTSLKRMAFQALGLQQKTDGLILRERALATLEKSPGIECRFIRRDSFWGGAMGRFHFDTQRQERVRQEFIENLFGNDYALCCRGKGNFSYRLYEALSAGRIPLFINSDCVMPLAGEVDWKKHVLWLEERELPRAAERLKAFHQGLGAEGFRALQRANRALWKEWFSPEAYYFRLLDSLTRGARG